MPPKRLFEDLNENIAELRRIVDNYARSGESSNNENGLVIPRAQVAALRDVLEVAQGKAARLVKKARRPPQRFADAQWHLLESRACLDATGFEKGVIEQVADALAGVVDVHAACGHRVGRREALAITLAKFSKPNATGDHLETVFGRPASVVSKITKHVVAAISTRYSTLLDLGRNPLLTEERVREYASALKLRKPAEGTTIPYYLGEESASATEEEQLLEKQRNRIFGILGVQKIQVKITGKEDSEPFTDPDVRQSVIKYVPVYAPDGLTLGLYGLSPGQLTCVDILQQKLANRDLRRFAYGEPEEAGKKESTEEQFGLYAGWLFDSVEDDAELARGVVTDVRLTQEYLKKNNLTKMHSIIFNEEVQPGGESSSSSTTAAAAPPAASTLTQYKCGACGRKLRYQLDDPTAWRIHDLQTYIGRTEVQHWWAEKRLRDLKRQPGEDSELWALKILSATKSEEFQTTWKSMAPTRRVEYAQKNLEDKIRFCVLFLNFVRCIEGIRSILGVSPPSLKRYLQYVDDTSPDANKFPEDADRTSADFVEEWGGVEDPAAYRPAELPVTWTSRPQAQTFNSSSSNLVAPDFGSAWRTQLQNQRRDQGRTAQLGAAFHQLIQLGMIERRGMSSESDSEHDHYRGYSDDEEYEGDVIYGGSESEEW